MQPTISEDKKERLTDTVNNLNEVLTDLLLVFDEMVISDERHKEFEALIDKVILALTELEEEINFS